MNIDCGAPWKDVADEVRETDVDGVVLSIEDLSNSLTTQASDISAGAREVAGYELFVESRRVSGVVGGAQRIALHHHLAEEAL